MKKEGDVVKGAVVTEFEQRIAEEAKNDRSYIEQSLDIIQHNELLKEEDFKVVLEIKDELNHNFQTSQMFRSRVEMEISVLNDAKFPTPDSKYWQSVREQGVHFQELVMLSYEYRKLAQKQKIIQATMEEKEEALRQLRREENKAHVENKVLPFETGIEIRKLEAEIEMKKIDLEKNNFIALNHSKVAKDRIREVLSWHEIMEKLKPHMLHGADSYEDHQLASYNLRFKNQIEIAKATNAKMDPAEAANLLGQAHTSERVLKGEGLKLGAPGSPAALKSGDKKELGSSVAQKLVMICSKCRRPITPDMTNCPNCGASFE